MSCIETRIRWVLVLSILLALAIPSLMAQNVSATLTGTVGDSTGAVIPKASVTIKNEASGDLRRTVSNSEGYFTFAAIPPGTYTVSVEMQGFNNWEMAGIVLNAADKRNLSNIALKVGATKDTVTVEASAELITPVDSGEKSTVINQKLLQNVAIIGQNAAEFIKIMPGMAITGGSLNQASYVAANEGTGNGPVGSFSSNGLRTGALDITSDGAHIIDPGCNCGQAVNTNADMTQELKVSTSNFGAEASKGPVVISAVGKSGGRDFHGEGYLYARHYSMNANDAINNAAGIDDVTGKMIAPRPVSKYYYPGGQIGGPVLIPGTNFNKNRDKLFFFFATEYYKQDIDNGTYQAVVPTAAMRKGDFSDSAYMSQLNGYAVTSINTSKYPGGIIPQSELTSKNGLYGKALVNVYPLPNANPGQNRGMNYINSQTRFANMVQIRPKIDYSINDNTKLYVSYNRQRDNSQESLDTLWTGNAQTWVSPTTPYPSPIKGMNVSDSISANMTRVFSPTLTNELVFTYTYLNLPNSFEDPSKVERGSLGLDYKTIFSHPDADKMIFPQMTGWSNGIANMLNTGFEINGVVYAKKTMPTIADNVSKVWGTHTSKFGFYWERTFNEQPGTGAVNGAITFANWGSTTTGNAYADMLTGRTTDYSEQNFNTIPGFRYMSVDFYGQDSWKISRRVTLEYGLRASHLGAWSDVTGYGFATWFPNLYSDNPADKQKMTGLLWHKRDPSVPLSGAPTRTLFYNPRFGFAYDIFGTGKTVLRGGYGMYRYHDEQNVQNEAYGITQGAYSWAAPGNPLLSELGSFQAGGFVAPGSVKALDPLDNVQPRTQSYSFTVAQRLPWSTVLEVAYVGNKADYLSNYNNNFNSLNLLPMGTMFQKEGWKQNYTTQDQYRPMHNYQSIKVITHPMYSNYNALQVSWNKQTGHLTFMTNYTFSKALGIRGEGGSAVGDPTVLANNYGTLPNNRPHIFNLAYVYELPNAAKSNRLLKGLVNNWQISGMTQIQSGSDIQAAMGSSNLNFSAYIPEGTQFMGTTITRDASDSSKLVQMSNNNMLGTGDLSLMPLVTCDPRQGLKSSQFVNGACFTPPHIGTNGNFIWPSMTGPTFMNNDISLFKNFVFSESRKLQFRASAYNFLNHPIPTFIQGDNNLKLTFNQQGQLDNPRFGFTDAKIGHRIIQLMVKFSF